jgi:hypothetical protein
VPLRPPQIQTWIDPGANLGLCGERPATNDLSHGTAQPLNYINIQGGYYSASPRGGSRALGRSFSVSRVCGGVTVGDGSWTETIAVRKTFRKSNKKHKIHQCYSNAENVALLAEYT